MATGPINWRELIKEGEGYNGPYRPDYRSNNVPAQEPMSVPVSEAAGKITPSGDTSGLYAIYGRKNPHAASADRYSRMSGMDMGGRLGQLPGIAATFMAGRAEKKSAEFEQDRASKVDAILARKEAWDKIQNDEAAQRRALDTFEKDIAPEAYKAFSSVYSETKDYNAASKAMAEAANAKVSERGLPIPMFKSISPFAKGEFAMIWDNAEGKPVQGMIDKNGNLGKKDADGKIVPADKNDMLFDSYTKLQDARNKETDTATRQLRAGTAGLKGREHGYLTAAGELFYSTDPDEAMKRGAVKVRSDVTKDGFKETVEDWLPGKAPAEAPEQPAPQAAPQGPGPLQRAAGAVAEQLRPSGGGMAGAVGRFVGGQPQGSSPQQAQPAQGLIRRASGGRIALFDPNTKEFVRWE